MSLIKSISGIRGTIGGKARQNLTPVDIVSYAAAYARFVQNHFHASEKKLKIVVGRDARISGTIFNNLLTNTLLSMGMDVVDIGLATTPTTEMAVVAEKAQGGIILTASHNPKEWNALKLLNSQGEFLSDKEGKEILAIAENEDFLFAEIDQLGSLRKRNYLKKHIKKILKLDLVDAEQVKKANLSVAVDGVNSVGGIAVPELLTALGVSFVEKLYCEPTGAFEHNPEPLAENLTTISEVVRKGGFDIGIVVDPDVDRLAIIDENGNMFGEEYTLVAVADYVLMHKRGNTVSNLSSSRALRVLTHRYGGEYYAAAVGEVNVVARMKEVEAVIGGEGNGGVIYPPLHYGRDALVGIALLLTYLAKRGISCSKLREEYPAFFMAKRKVKLTPSINVDQLLTKIEAAYKNQNNAWVTTIDGVKIDFENEWVHLRKSNTEPIIRVYTESQTQERAHALADQIIDNIQAMQR